MLMVSTPKTELKVIIPKGPTCTSIIGPGHAKTCLMTYANNKGVDQPAHLRSLISIFVVRCLDSICIQKFKSLASFYS